MNPRTLVILDGQNLIYRSMFVSTGFADWEPQVAFEHICSQFLRRFEDRPHWKSKYTHLVVAWDGRGVDPYRRDIYPEYKRGEGKSTVTDAQKAVLFKAKDWLQDFLRATCVDQVGFPKDEAGEADDLIAWLILRAAREDFDVELYSSDKDFYQLQSRNENLCQIRPGFGSSLDVVKAENVLAQLNVPPSSYVWMKCLDGDPSDNVPGWKGVGPKTIVGFLELAGLDVWGERHTLSQAKKKMRAAMKSDKCPARIKRAGDVDELFRALTLNYKLMKLPGPKALRISERAVVTPGRTARAEGYLEKGKYSWILSELSKNLLKRRRKWSFLSRRKTEK